MVWIGWMDSLFVLHRGVILKLFFVTAYPNSQPQIFGYLRQDDIRINFYQILPVAPLFPAVSTP